MDSGVLCKNFRLITYVDDVQQQERKNPLLNQFFKRKYFGQQISFSLPHQLTIVLII